MERYWGALQPCLITFDLKHIELKFIIHKRSLKHYIPILAFDSKAQTELLGHILLYPYTNGPKSYLFKGLNPYDDCSSGHNLELGIDSEHGVTVGFDFIFKVIF